MLHRNHINLWTVLASQNDTLQTRWKNTFRPLTPCWKWLGRGNNHKNVIVPSDNSHYTHSATFFYIPEQTCGTGKTKLRPTCMAANKKVNMNQSRHLDMHVVIKQLKHKKYSSWVKPYPSFNRIIRSSLDRFLSASHLTNSGDMSLFDWSISTTIDSST